MSTITLKTMTGTTQTVALAQAKQDGSWTINNEGHAARVEYFEAGNENAIPAAGLADRAGTEIIAMPKVVTDCQQMAQELKPEFLAWLVDSVPSQLLEERAMKYLPFDVLLQCRTETPDPIPEWVLRKLLDDDLFYAVDSFVDMGAVAAELAWRQELDGAVDFHEQSRMFLSNLWYRSADASSLSYEQRQAQYVRIMSLIDPVHDALYRIAMEHYGSDADSDLY